MTTTTVVATTGTTTMMTVYDSEASIYSVPACVRVPLLREGVE